MSLKSKCDQYDTLVKELFRLVDVTGQPNKKVGQGDFLEELNAVLVLLKSTMEDKA